MVAIEELGRDRATQPVGAAVEDAQGRDGDRLVRIERHAKRRPWKSVWTPTVPAGTTNGTEAPRGVKPNVPAA